jgi:polysaccharide chain length determinant protein (PEP-CTERM system associated)
LLGATSAPVATPEIDARIDAQRRGLDTLLQRFTDQHPDVLAARRVIKDLEEQRQREIASLKAKAASAPAPMRQSPGASLAYQELTRVVATTDVQLAAARARVAEYTSRLEQARAKLKEAPRIEAEAAQLNRDYNVHRRAYEELVQRRESAAIYNKLDDAAGLAEFRVIEPARVPQKPAFPNRPLMLLMALAGALGAGLAVAFLKAQIKPVFHRPSELHSRLGLPLLGAVSTLRSEADARKERWEYAGLSAASGSLVILFAIGALVTAVLRS